MLQQVPRVEESEFPSLRFIDLVHYSVRFYWLIIGLVIVGAIVFGTYSYFSPRSFESIIELPMARGVQGEEANFHASQDWLLALYQDPIRSRELVDEALANIDSQANQGTHSNAAAQRLRSILTRMFPGSGERKIDVEKLGAALRHESIAFLQSGGLGANVMFAAVLKAMPYTWSCTARLPEPGLGEEFCRALLRALGSENRVNGRTGPTGQIPELIHRNIALQRRSIHEFEREGHTVMEVVFEEKGKLSAELTQIEGALLQSAQGAHLVGASLNQTGTGSLKTRILQAKAIVEQLNTAENGRSSHELAQLALRIVEIDFILDSLDEKWRDIGIELQKSIVAVNTPFNEGVAKWKVDKVAASAVSPVFDPEASMNGRLSTSVADKVLELHSVKSGIFVGSLLGALAAFFLLFATMTIKQASQAMGQSRLQGRRSSA